MGTDRARRNAEATWFHRCEQRPAECRLTSLADLRPPTAARLGISAQLIDDTLYDAFGQRQVSTMFTSLNQYHVVMEVDPQFWQSPKGLDTIYVRPNMTSSSAGSSAQVQHRQVVLPRSTHEFRLLQPLRPFLLHSSCQSLPDRWTDRSSYAGGAICQLCSDSYAGRRCYHR